MIYMHLPTFPPRSTCTYKCAYLPAYLPCLVGLGLACASTGVGINVLPIGRHLRLHLLAWMARYFCFPYTLSGQQFIKIYWTCLKVINVLSSSSARVAPLYSKRPAAVLFLFNDFVIFNKVCSCYQHEYPSKCWTTHVCDCCGEVTTTLINAHDIWKFRWKAQYKNFSIKALSLCRFYAPSWILNWIETFINGDII